MSFALGRVRMLTAASSTSSSSLLRPTTQTLAAFSSNVQSTARAFATGQSVLSAPPLKSVKDGSDVKMSELFGKKRVVVFGVVGAFTTTCQTSHVPLYVDAVEDLKEKKVDEIVCVTVNDRFVADAWKKELKLDDNDIKLLIDPDAAFTKALGLELDLSAVGLGLRSKRYSILVEDGVIKLENVAKNAAAVESTGPDAILKVL
jgi:peroxiredoxin